MYSHRYRIHNYKLTMIYLYHVLGSGQSDIQSYDSCSTIITRFLWDTDGASRLQAVWRLQAFWFLRKWIWNPSLNLWTKIKWNQVTYIKVSKTLLNHWMRNKQMKDTSINITLVQMLKNATNPMYCDKHPLPKFLFPRARNLLYQVKSDMTPVAVAWFKTPYVVRFSVKSLQLTIS